MAKKIGYTCGVYDLFHIGHLNLFERCKANCDYLIVGVCDDDYVRQYKSKDPVINETDRVRIVKALKCVDDAYIVVTVILACPSIFDTCSRGIPLRKALVAAVLLFKWIQHLLGVRAQKTNMKFS